MGSDPPMDPATLLPMGNEPTRDEAWARTIKTLGAEYPTNPRILQEAVFNAHEGWRSTAWNYAVQAGIPAEVLRGPYILLFE